MALGPNEPILTEEEWAGILVNDDPTDEEMELCRQIDAQNKLHDIGRIALTQEQFGALLLRRYDTPSPGIGC
jgi:hypothetical protein